MNELNTNDLNEISIHLKIYSLLSEEYKTNVHNRELIDYLRNKIQDIIDCNNQ